MSETRMVIVGGGLAGAKAAETLRSEGYDGGIVLIGDEADRPYERPALSKGYLQGQEDRDSVFVHAADWYDKHDVDLRTGVRATALDLAAESVELEDGERIPFSRLLLATGASPRPLAVPGADASGVRYLRRLADSDRLRDDFGGAPRRVVVVGGGWIGLEVAAAARTAGHEVTVVEPQPMVLRGALGDELGGVFADIHRSKGVRLMLGVGVSEVRSDGESVNGVVLEDGSAIPADVVVAGVGAAPNVELAEAAGLDIDDGVLVDASLRTSHPLVHAAGDLARAFNPLLGRHIRVEHWANALNSGPAAARAMLGQDVSYDRVPYFYTDQYDLGMEYSGDVGPDGFDRIVYRGDRESGSFIAFWLREGRVVAGMNVNVWDVTDGIQALIRSGGAVDAAALADPDTPLADAVRG